MNIFEKLLEIKIGRKDLVVKAVYIPNATSDWKGAYFVYYYDLFTHSFYINDLDNLCNNTRTRAINIIEHILNGAYNKEMFSLAKVIREIQMRKKPQVFCIYNQKKSQEVVIDTISFKYGRSLKWRIIEFKNPKWETPLEDTLVRLWLK